MTDRAAFQRSLPGCGFAPPEADVAALAASLPAGRDARFAAEVASFAGSYWDFAPDDRRGRWEELNARVVGAAATWLAALAPGLDVVPLGHTDPGAAELSRLVRELFVLRPRTRADRRLRWLTAEGGRFPALARAARKLLRTDMPLAQLEPRVFDWLVSGSPPEPVAGESPAEDTAVPPPHRAWGLYEWRTTTAVVALFLVVVMSSYLVSRGSTSANPPPPPPHLAAPAARFTGPEVDRLREYERSGVVYPVPPRYGQWVGAGRPDPGVAP